MRCRRSVSSVQLLAVTTLLFGAEPAKAQPKPEPPTEDQILRQAVEARDAAVEALERANKALAEVSAALEKRRDLNIVIEPRTEHLTPAQCAVSPQNVGYIHRQAREYAQTCLSKGVKPRFVLTGVAQSDGAAILGTYTRRNLISHSSNGKWAHDHYHRVRLGFTAAKSGDNFPIFDFAGAQWLRGWGLTGGYEFGRSRARSNIDQKVKEYLASARRDCIAARLADPASEPLQTNTSLALRTRLEVETACDGRNLSNWIDENPERSGKYYEAFSNTVFQPDDVPGFYGGLNGSVAFPRFDFVPAINLPLMPVEGEPSKPKSQSFDATTHELRAYLGGYTKENFALEVGLSHRRIFEQADKRTICPIGTAGFVECWSFRTEKPSKLEGFVADARAALSLRFPFVRKVGLLVMPSYEFDVNRPTASGSIFFAVDKEGKLSSGLNVRCKGRGKSRSGITLDKDCKAEVFIATEFKVKDN